MTDTLRPRLLGASQNAARPRELYAARDRRGSHEAGIYIAISPTECAASESNREQHEETGFSLVRDISPYEDVIGCALEEMTLLQGVEDRISALGVEIPQTLCLPFREVKTRHLRVLGLDKPNPIMKVFKNHCMLH